MKKTKVMILICLISAVVLSMGYEYSLAESKAEKPSLNIGVVSVRKILEDSKRSEKHDEELRGEEDKISAVLRKLRKEIEADEAGLGTLKRESSAYLELERDVEQKRADYLAQKGFYEKKAGLKDRQWLKGFYKDILQETREVAKEKGLDLVFERSEPDFSMESAGALLVSIETHKLLYCGDCSDITKEVMGRLDGEESRIKMRNDILR